MLGINARLKARHEEGRPIKVGLIGSGQMGTGMVSQVSRMRGMDVAAIADIDEARAVEAYVRAGVAREDVVVSEKLSVLEEALHRGRPVVTSDASLVSSMGGVEVVVDATGVPEVGAQVAFAAIQNGKHIVMLNVEADITVGFILKSLADRAGVVYTGSAGDEPGAIKELYDFADALGFEVVVAGKGKNNPLDRAANPDRLAEAARAQGVNPKMLTSFVDGTKTMVEMTAVANAIGFVPDIPGMHGPRATVGDLPVIFSTREQGGILGRTQVVDFANGVAPGVFVVVTTDLPVIREELAYLKMGNGPNYVFYRPYHLTSIETPLSAARAAIYGEPTIAPSKHMAECVAVAKKDLTKGDRLDGIGAFSVYGNIVTAEEAKLGGYLPLGLVNSRTVVNRDIRQGEIIALADVILDESSVIVQLRRLQDKLCRYS